MTRTHIIAADGTRFAQVGRTKIIARRWIGGIFLIITALFLSAAVIGLQRAAIEGDDQQEVTSYNEGWDDALADIVWIRKQPGGQAKITACMNSTETAPQLHICLGQD